MKLLQIVQVVVHQMGLRGQRLIETDDCASGRPLPSHERLKGIVNEHLCGNDHKINFSNCVKETERKRGARQRERERAKQKREKGGKGEDEGEREGREERNERKGREGRKREKRSWPCLP